MYYQKEVFFKKNYLRMLACFQISFIKIKYRYGLCICIFSDEDLDVECSNWSDGAKDTPSENKHYIQPK